MSPIAVFGETLVDQFDSGPVVGGAPFNVARHLAAFGLAPLMLSAIGEDAAGQAVRAEFDRYGLARDGLQQGARHPTGVVDVQMQPGGGHRFLIREASAWDFIDGRAVAALGAGLRPGGWLYFGTLALRSAVSRATWEALARAHAGPVYLDLNWREGQVSRETACQAMARADVLKLNDEELAMVLAWLGHEGAAPVPGGDAEAGPGGRPAPGVQALMQAFALRTLVVTCGAAGYLAFDAQGCRIAQGRGTRALALVDTVGAGDAFSAVVLAGLVRGWPLAQTLARANGFAGRICEQRGAVPADLAAYATWTAGWGLGAR
jgi:fructokinase